MLRFYSKKKAEIDPNHNVGYFCKLYDKEKMIYFSAIVDCKKPEITVYDLDEEDRKKIDEDELIKLIEKNIDEFHAD